MTSLIRDVFLNVTLSITMITLWKFYSRKYVGSVFYQKLILTLTALVSIILVFSFPIDLLGRFELNFLHIPIGIIGLYGGIAMSLIMFIGALPFLFLFIEDGLEVAIILLIVQTVINVILSKYFIKWKAKIKIIIGTLNTSIILVIFLVNMVFQYQVNNSIINLGIGIFFIQILCIAFYFYLIENFRLMLVTRETLLKAQKMEGLYHLAASFGHEIRQPLTISKGMLQLLTEEKWANENQQKFLLSSIAEINRAEKIIKNYQIFAEPFPSKLEQFDLVDEIHLVVNLIKPIANRSSIHIQTDLSSAWVIGDKSKIEQCLLHICTNAVEAMQSGGNLTIYSKNIKGKSIIDISDTGIGMTREQISRLGEPFFSLNDQKGTGLGMMVVFRIIEGMKGKLEIKSEVGKGTNVRIIFDKI